MMGCSTEGNTSIKKSNNIIQYRKIQDYSNKSWPSPSQIKEETSQGGLYGIKAQL